MTRVSGKSSSVDRQNVSDNRWNVNRERRQNANGQQPSNARNESERSGSDTNGTDCLQQKLKQRSMDVPPRIA